MNTHWQDDQRPQRQWETHKAWLEDSKRPGCAWVKLRVYYIILYHVILLYYVFIHYIMLHYLLYVMSCYFILRELLPQWFSDQASQTSPFPCTFENSDVSFVIPSFMIHVCTQIYIYTLSHVALDQTMDWGVLVRGRSTHHTVSFHDFKSRNFKLSVSNPKSKYVSYLSVLSQISNCQGLGRKNKLENWP